MRGNAALNAGLVTCLALLLGACAQTKLAVHTVKQFSREAPPAEGGVYKVGNPYEVNGVWYVPHEDPAYVANGIASWYGHPFHGQRTANGEIYDMNALSAAHQTLPMPTFVRVTNLENGRSLILRVNDRGPFVNGRIIDVSHRSAQLLGFAEKGTARVRIEAVPGPSENLVAAAQQPQPPDSPNVAAVPSPVVAVNLLEPVAGVPAARQYAGAEGLGLAEGALPPQIKIVNVPQTAIYIQAGAFSRYETANDLRLELNHLGNVGVSSIDVNGRQLYRVRVGPLDNVARADATLAMVMARGYTEARIVVD